MKKSTKKKQEKSVSDTEVNICVTCSTLGECEDVFILTFEETRFISIFNSCMGFELSEDSKLKYMCLGCINTIISYYTFKQAALKSFELLSIKEAEIKSKTFNEVKQPEKTSESSEHIVFVSIDDANLIDIDDIGAQSDGTVDSVRPDIIEPESDGIESVPDALESEADAVKLDPVAIKTQSEIKKELTETNVKQEDNCVFLEEKYDDCEETPNKTVKKEVSIRLSTKELKEKNQWQCTYCNIIISKNNPAGIKKHSAGTCTKDISIKPKQTLVSEEFVLLCCLCCEFRTSSEDELKKHSLTHKGCDIFEIPPRKYGCSRCEYMSSRKRDTQRHLLTHLKKEELPMLSCDQCDFSSPYNSSVLQHIRRVHTNERKDDHLREIYRCEKCDFSSFYKNSLITHQLQHKEPMEQNVYYCDNCEFNTIYKTNLRAHVLLHKPSGQVSKFVCDICGFSTLYKKSHRTHILTHTNATKKEEENERKRKNPNKGQDKKRRIKRRKVGQDTTGAEEQEQEKIMRGRKVGKGYIWECDECNYKTNCVIGLRSHKMSHIPKELHYCDQCTFNTPIKQSLKDHLKTHKDPDEVKIHRCKYCSFRTAYSSALKMHVLRHVPKREKMLYCDECDFKTIYRLGLKLHQNSHKNPEDVVKIKCLACKYASTSDSNVRRHEWTRHGIKRIKREWTVINTNTC